MTTSKNYIFARGGYSSSHMLFFSRKWDAYYPSSVFFYIRGFAISMMMGVILVWINLDGSIYGDLE